MNESKQYDWMVCVKCMTFNHALFIEDALNGFCMQETNFPYICIIIDDCSTDGEQDIIKQYVNEHFDYTNQSLIKKEESEDYKFICARNKSNPNCFFAVYYLKYNHYSLKKPKLTYYEKWIVHSKYVAICEGDDYWVNPLKLQKQVEFMNAHIDYSMCFTDVQNFYVKLNSLGDRQSLKYGAENEKLDKLTIDPFYSILQRKCRIQTLSVVYRSILNESHKREPIFMMGDTPMWLDLSQKGRIKFIDECTGVYRIHKGSASRNSRTKILFRFSMYEMRVYYCIKYNKEIPYDIKRSYNTALFNLIANGKDKDHAPLFELFPINTFQQALYLKVKKRIIPKFSLRIYTIVESLLKKIGV